MSHKKGAAFALSMCIAFAGIAGAMRSERLHSKAAGYGDLDGDGAITAVDAQSVLSAYTNCLVSNVLNLTPSQAKNCDIDSDSDITAADAQYILIYYTENSVTGNPTSWKTLLSR